MTAHCSTRATKQFMIQAGDPTAKTHRIDKSLGSGDGLTPFLAEFNPKFLPQEREYWRQHARVMM